MTTNLLAAANPSAQFWAVDFNPAHIATGRKLAEEAQLSNVKFIDSSFEDFARSDVPEFDYVGLHGVYSWISPENRGHIVDLLLRKLKPGGAVYISYNCLPGWAPFLPLRHLLTEHAALEIAPTVHRINKSLQFAEEIAKLKLGYFAAAPRAAERLERIKRMSRNYLAHEYFNRDWHPQYFAELARELSRAKLVFATTAHLVEYIELLGASKEVIALLQGISEPIFRQTVRDFIFNQQFRRDIFVRGATMLPREERDRRLDRTTFALTVPRGTVALEFKLGERTVSLKPEIYGPILDGFAEAPRSIQELAGLKSTESVGRDALVQGVLVLASLGMLLPCGDAAEISKAHESTKRINAVILRESELTDRTRALASPMTAGPIRVDWIEQLFLAAERNNGDPAGHAWDVIRRLGLRVQAQGDGADNEESGRAKISEVATLFATQRLPALKQLSII
jgi:SAM-dependent methyltransferase